MGPPNDLLLMAFNELLASPREECVRNLNFIVMYLLLMQINDPMVGLREDCAKIEEFCCLVNYLFQSFNAIGSKNFE